MIYTRAEAIPYLDQLGENKIPFVLFTDFLAEKTWIKPIDEIDPDELRYQFGDQQNPVPSVDFQFQKFPISFNDFRVSYDQVLHELNIGNSYLVNLTFKTRIKTSLSFDQIFELSKAKYKLKYKDKFVVFSPETFIRMENGFIYSYPMKGTIDATIPEADRIILEDPKELSEHVTIVDLIRNDISQVAQDVEVSKFRFISEVKTNEKTLLQVSSEIKGRLIDKDRIGSIIFKLLPAGSISGAPKNKTVKIISQAENYDRGFFTGICGIFDGKVFDSGVMIRFIEKENDTFYFKSGGGITALSDPKKEYNEFVDKVYVPIH